MRKVKLLIICIFTLNVSHSQIKGTTFFASITPVYRVEESRISVVPSFGYGINFIDRNNHLDCFGITIDFSGRNLKSTNNEINSGYRITEYPISLFWSEIKGSHKVKLSTLVKAGLNLMNKNYDLSGSGYTEKYNYKSRFIIGVGIGVDYNIYKDVSLSVLAKLECSPAKVNYTSISSHSNSSGAYRLTYGNSGINFGLRYTIN